jgi:hypothetical protein
MTRIIRWLSPLAACLLAGCDDPHRSLIGAWAIASDAELAQETVTLGFRKENGTDYPATLSYVIDPHGLLTIEKGRDHAVCCYGGIDKHLTDARWKKQLSSEEQIKIRRLLARLRPQALSKDFPFALPKGCGFTTDSRPWSVVGFLREKEGGEFLFQPGCHSAGGSRAKRLLRSVVAALPPVEGSAEFTAGPPAGAL